MKKPHNLAIKNIHCTYQYIQNVVSVCTVFCTTFTVFATVG